jgi:hypothetical protein
MNIFGKKYSGDMEFGFSHNEEANETTKIRIWALQGGSVFIII